MKCKNVWRKKKQEICERLHLLRSLDVCIAVYGGVGGKLCGRGRHGWLVF